MWGIVPAAGRGSRIQPLAFSKELLPIGSRIEHGVERPRAVSEYLVERMRKAGATKLCFVIGPGKADILAYYGAGFPECAAAYVVQPSPAGLCDAIFRPVPFVSEGEDVLIGLPDTVWFPEDGFELLPAGRFSLLLFPVEEPQHFDAVSTDGDGRVLRIEVKEPRPQSNWVWGAMRMPGRVYLELHALWRSRSPRDEYLGTLIEAYLGAGGIAHGVPAGRAYVDLGTIGGYREATRLLAPEADAPRWHDEAGGVPMTQTNVSKGAAP